MSGLAIASRVLLVGLSLLLIAPATATGAVNDVSGVTILLTADGEGHIGPCSNCPVGVGLGGMSRRASLIVAKRKDSASVLLLDAGNSLFGSDSAASEGKIIVAAFDAMGYDAINISPRDFSHGKAMLLAAVKGAKFASISANLLDADSGRELFTPFLVKTVGGRKVALIGICEVPAGLSVLSYLKQELTGVRIRPPIEALGEWLPKAKAQADQVVLLYYGSAAGLWPVRQKFGAELAAICVGGINARAADIHADLPILWATEHGKSVAHAVLDGGAAAKVDQLPVTPDIAPDPAMEKLLAGYAPTPTDAASTAAPTASQPPQPTGPPALVPKGIEGVGLTAEQVNHAIDHGAEFLWGYLKEKYLKGDLSKLGKEQPDILCCLALVHSGAQKKYPDFDAALRQMLAKAKPADLRIYNSGLLNMLIEGYGDPQFFPLLEESSRYLFESQGPGGMFEYTGCASDFANIHPDAGQVLEVVGGIPPGGSDVAAWQHLLTPKETYDGDNSVSQFASLGLLTAARSGIRLPAATWKGLLAGYRGRQSDDGGWGYHAAGGSYGSMTCAGLCNLAIARYELGEKDPADDPAIHRGVAWLNANFTVTDNPKQPGDWVFYYLYSLERTGQILQTEFIGSHEWYPLGAKHLVDSQNADGSWIGKPPEDDPRLATSFALLFLTRATTPLRQPINPNQMGSLRTAIVSPPPLRLYIILDCSGSMLDDMQGKQKFQIARGAVANLVSQLPPETTIGLRVYGHRKTALDKDCDLDTELLIPMSLLDQKLFAAKLKGLHARGKTPLALSLHDAIADIGDSDQPTELLLLTDGGEDTMPRKNPVKAADDVAKTGKIHLDIVGFDVENHEEWKQQLIEMAKQGNGDYWPAIHEADLNQQLISALFKKPDGFVVLDHDSKEVARGVFGDVKPLPQGQYTLVTHFKGQEIHQTFWINGGQQTGVNFNAMAASGQTGATK